MRRLILMRHAKSAWNNPGIGDHDRPLNGRGKRAAQGLGDWLRTQGFLPDQILCSSAARTRETLARLALPDTIPTTLTRDLYLAEASEMLAILRQATGDCVLMLGHNGGIADTAWRLVGDAPPKHDRFSDFPTGATLVCDFDVTTWADLATRTARTQAFVTPHDLVGAV